jgi:uncharacterized membrane protein YeaQ/YmgE (transglycosylase-associated protein family)
LAARLVTFTKTGFGWWSNLGIGMAGAILGGFLFRVLGIDFKLGELKITFEDLISAFVGSLIFVGLWWVVRRFRGGEKAEAFISVSDKGKATK